MLDVDTVFTQWLGEQFVKLINLNVCPTTTKNVATNVTRQATYNKASSSITYELLTILNKVTFLWQPVTVKIYW